MSEVIHGDGRGDQLNARSDKTQVYGLAGNDTLTSDSKREVLLVGGSGNDSLIIMGGDGTLSGGAGSDTFELNYSADKKLSAVIEDFDPSSDKIVVTFDGNSAPQIKSSTLSGGDVVLSDGDGLFNATLKSIRENDYFDGTADEQIWRVLELTNAEREKQNLPALTLSEGLMEGASIRAEEITEIGAKGELDVYKHVRPDNRNYDTVFDDVGKHYSNFGENLDGGANSPAQVMSDWMNSDDHRENILRENFRKLGVGFNENDLDPSDLRYYWTQLFADSLASSERATVSAAQLLTADIFSATVSKSITLTEDDDTYSNSDYGTKIAALGGNDLITNSGLNVSISGGNDSDTIDSSGSFATINAGAGDDSIRVSGKENLIQYATGDGNDIIIGFNETSTLSVSSDEFTPPEIFGNDLVVAVGADSITLSGAANLTSVNILSPALVIGGNDTQETGLNLSNVMNSMMIVGTSYADTIYNRGSNVTVDAVGGNDFIENDGSNTSIQGGEGADRISNLYGDNVTLDGGVDDDTITNSDIYSNIAGNNSSISGGEGHDIIDNYGNNVTIIGNDGRDTIENYGSYVKIEGGTGYDDIYNYRDFVTINSGPTGSDYIYNNGGNHVSIVGSIHDNLIRSNGSNVTINSGTGADSLTLSGSNVFVDSGEDNDTIYTASVGSNMSINTGDGADYISNSAGSVTLDAGAGADRISLSGSNIIVDSGKDNDTIYTASVGSNMSINTGDGADYISNSAGSVTLDAGDGADTITNFGEDVFIDSGDGNDTIDNFSSNVTINSGEGDDIIENSNTNNLINMGAGDDTISNNSENVTITGGEGDDSIYSQMADTISIGGGDGNDTISIWGRAVTVQGGAGDDWIENHSNFMTYYMLFEYAAGDGSDTITGFGETSTLKISGDEYSLSKRDNDLIVAVGNDSITLLNAATLSVVNINGTLKQDSEEDGLITLSENADDFTNTLEGATVRALGGDDTISNALANVSIDAGNDNDFITNTGANVSINGEVGNDTISNTGGAVSINGAAGKDSIVSSGSNVTINSGAGDDTIENYGANVTIDSGAGYNFIVLSSQAQNNLIEHVSGSANKISGFNQDDTLRIGDGTEAYFTHVERNDLVVRAGSGFVILEDAASLASNIKIEGTPAGFRIEGNVVTLTEGNDNFSNYFDGAEIHALGGDDYIYSSSAYYSPTVEAGAGNDTIENNSDNVSISGGAGDDSIDSMGDESTIDSGDDNDHLETSGQNVTVTSGAGDDTIYNFADSAIINASTGNDSIKNNGGQNVTITAGEGDDTIRIYHGTNVLISGGQGNDLIHNNLNEEWNNETATWETLPSNITISGGDDSDTITNEGNNVTITGGQGNDLISLSAAERIQMFDGETLELFNDANNNVIEYTAGDGFDTVYGFNATSTLNISADEYTPMTVGNDVVITVGAETITLMDAATLSVVNINGTEHAFPTLSKYVQLTEEADNYYNNRDGVTIEALGGDDTISNNFGGSNASISGGKDNDRIINTATNVTITSDDGNDNILNGGATTVIDTGADDDSIDNAGANVTISSNTGNDSITLGSNARYNLIRYTAGFDTVYGFNGDDSLMIGDGSGSYSAETLDADVVINVGEGSILLAGAATLQSVDIIANRGENISNALDSIIITGTERDDTIENDGANVTINALGGNDSISNSGVNVTVVGGEGNDSIDNSGANVSIQGGADNDSIWNHDTGDNSTIQGGDGDDTINNLGESVFISGGRGKDYIPIITYWVVDYVGRELVRPKNITIDAGADDDFVANDGESLLIYLGTGDDTVENGGNTVTIDGGKGNDYIGGFGVNSSLIGGSGDDTLIGDDASHVTIIGGSGDDQISLSDRSEYQYVEYKAGDGNDTIWGLSPNSSINFLNISAEDYSTIGSGDDIIIKVGDGSITLKDVRNNPPHVIIGESGSSGGGSGGSGGGSSGGGDSGGGSSGGGGSSSGGTSGSSGSNSGASGGNSASGSDGGGGSGGGAASGSSGSGGGSSSGSSHSSGSSNSLRAHSTAVNLERTKLLGFSTDSTDSTPSTPSTPSTTSTPSITSTPSTTLPTTPLTDGNYTGGNRLVSNYTSWQKITFNEIYKGAFYDGANLIVRSSSGLLAIENAADKIIDLVDGAGRDYIKSYTASTAGVIDGRDVAGFEIINGSGGADEIYAGNNGSQLWGGLGDVADVLVGGRGSDVFIGGQTQGQDALFNVSSKDIVHISDANLSDIIAISDNDGVMVVAFGTGNIIGIQYTSSDTNFVFADGSARHYDHTTKSWQTT